MAKFSRHDPRNKKQRRNKMRSMDKDLRIHEERRREKYQNWEDHIEDDLEDQPSYEFWDDE